jgi:hypothetical protein
MVAPGYFKNDAADVTPQVVATKQRSTSTRGDFPRPHGPHQHWEPRGRARQRRQHSQFAVSAEALQATAINVIVDIGAIEVVDAPRTIPRHRGYHSGYNVLPP